MIWCGKNSESIFKTKSLNTNIKFFLLMTLHNRRFFNLVFISIYILVALYVILFRVIYNIVGSNEPEYYPLEISTTIAVILSIVLSSLIFYENKKQTGEIDKLYLILFIFFIAYYLAENNWLFGREFFIGTVAYAIIAGIVFLLILARTYNLEKSVFLIFLLGVICLAIGTIIDGIIDDVIPLTLDISNRTLYEEVPEVYASLFFLHSLLFFYFYTTKEKSWFLLDNVGASIIVICSIIIGYGTSYFLLDHGRPIQLDRLVIGVILYLIGLFLVFGYFVYYWFKDQEKYWLD
jgi:hypothetical protein